MQKLNFPSYTFRIKSSNNKTLIFDEIRKKFVSLQPEEWVRQHVIQFLKEKSYPVSLINVEKKLIVNQLTKRYDLIVFHTDGSILLVVECKSPDVVITQDTFDQIARYNLTLQSDLMMITNGLQHFFCTMDYETKSYHFLKDLPNYSK